MSSFLAEFLLLCRFQYLYYRYGFLPNRHITMILAPFFPLWLFPCGMGFDTFPLCPLLIWCNVHKADWSSKWLQPLENWRDRATQAVPQLSLPICFSLGRITLWMLFGESDLVWFNSPQHGDKQSIVSLIVKLFSIECVPPYIGNQIEIETVHAF